MDAFLAGKTFGGYRVGEPLGPASSVLSVVYSAEPINGGDKIALRVFSLDLARDKNLAARLVADLKKACSIKHPNLVPVHEINTADFKGKRYLYIAMERLDGESLKSRLARPGGRPLPLHEALHIASQVGAALQAIHRGGGTHRHLAPGAVLLARPAAADAATKVYLLDLGSALIPTGEGGQGPTSGAAKEKRSGKTQDDIRGLAQLVQEMLTPARSDAAANDAHATTVLPLCFCNVNVPARIDAVLRSALGDTLGPGDRSARFESVASFVAALLGTGDTQPAWGVWSDDGHSLPPPHPSPTRNLAWAAIFAIVVGALVGYWIYAQQETPPIGPSTVSDLAVPVSPSAALPASAAQTAIPAALPSTAAVDLGLQPGRPLAWPVRPGKIPPLRDADPASPTSAAAPAVPGAQLSAPAPATRAPATAPAGGATTGAPSTPAAPKTQPVAKPPAPQEGPGATSPGADLGPGPGGQ